MPRKRKSSTGARRKHDRVRPYPAPSHEADVSTDNSELRGTDQSTDTSELRGTDQSTDTSELRGTDQSTDTSELRGTDQSTETCDLHGAYIGNFDVLTEFETLRQQLQSSVEYPFTFVTTGNGHRCIQIIQLNQSDDKSAVRLKLEIDQYFVPKLHVHNKEVPKSHAVWDSVPFQLNREWHVLKLLANIKKFHVCIGNPDDELTAITAVGTSLSDNKAPVVLAYHEGDFCARQGDFAFSSTIRTVKCSLLANGVRCQICQEYRRNLRKRKERIDEIKLSYKDFTKSTFKHSDMPREVLIKKLYQQKAQIKTLAHEVDKLNRDLRKEIKRKVGACDG